MSLYYITPICRILEAPNYLTAKKAADKKYGKLYETKVLPIEHTGTHIEPDHYSTQILDTYL